jgi:UDP-N-acetylmuramate--alanine ligase
MAESRIHFVGIGGIGMSGIARVLLKCGIPVSGSDARESQNTRDLREAGAEIAIGHAAANVQGASKLVFSAAIRPDNPEMVEARRLGIPLVRRAEMLSELLNSRRGITVAGTHGKTTTSSMVATVLLNAGLQPTYVIGGIINAFSGNAGVGESELFVIEADESDGSLVLFNPEVAILTNIEQDHMDYFRDESHLFDVFRTYVSNIKPNGICIWCADDAGTTRLMQQLKDIRQISYGLCDGADLTARAITFNGLGSSYEVWHKGERLGDVRLLVPGRHNVQNSLAVIAAGLHIGLSFEQIAEAILKFTGVKRRFQVIGKNADYMVVDDYAHHPSEIRATLSAARNSHQSRIIGIFQPHRYTRTQSLAHEFGSAFGNADTVVVTDIYGADEEPIPQVTSDLIVQSLRDNQHPSVHFVQGLDNVEEYVAQLVQPNDMVIFLGAGDIWKVAESLSRRLIA